MDSGNDARASRFRIDDTVRRKSSLHDCRGRVVGFTERGGQALVIVWWDDPRLFPNPTAESEESLDVAESPPGR